MHTCMYMSFHKHTQLCKCHRQFCSSPPFHTPSARSYFKHLINCFRTVPGVICPLLPQGRAIGLQMELNVAARQRGEARVRGGLARDPNELPMVSVCVSAMTVRSRGNEEGHTGLNRGTAPRFKSSLWSFLSLFP